MKSCPALYHESYNPVEEVATLSRDATPFKLHLPLHSFTTFADLVEFARDTLGIQARPLHSRRITLPPLPPQMFEPNTWIDPVDKENGIGEETEAYDLFELGFYTKTL
jgi:hypothetical protein